MSFESALSGLAAASQDLDVIGNNVANSGTVGFKQSQIQFSDVYANSLSGAGASQIGIGTKVAQVAQQFTQGNITATSNPLDVAINGGGFFRMDNNGTVSFARNGQFQLDKTGYIVDANNDRLTGYTANAAGLLSTGAPADLNINTANLPPKTTSTVNALLNLNAASTVPTNAFNINDPTSYNNATSVSVYDSLGNSHILQTFYVTNGAGSWNVYATSDGVPIGYTPPAAAVPVGTLSFSTSGTVTSGSPIAVSMPVGTGAATPLNVSVNYAGTTQYGSAFSVNSLQQNGYTSGQLNNFSIGKEGTITGSYTNGQTATLGQVVLANFTDPNGLQSMGNNQWVATAASGPPLVGTPGSASLGVLQSSATESSNVDLTTELVNMITAQRNYQANAQTIKTEDALTQTLINLR
ncbi:MAG: flagellar hook protein FlgE [Sulfuriferula sp.]